MSKGKYIWDPDKQAWVSPSEAKGEDRTDDVSQPSAETSKESEPISAEGQKEATEAELEAGWLEYKGALIRLVAIVIDLIVVLIVSSIASLPFGTETIVSNGTEETVSKAPEWLTLIVGFVYFIGFWSWRGQTIGKMAIRAKIVKTDGSPIALTNVILRYVFYLLPIFAPILYFADLISGLIALPGAVIGFAIIALTREKRGLHDMIAGTVVVNSRPVEPLVDATEEDETTD